MTGKRVTRLLRDGLVLDVRDEGPHDGAPVVLLHGFPQDSRCWHRVTPLLHELGYRTLAPDQRGYAAGARPRSRWAYRRSALRADVVALVEEVGAGPVHLVGHDWGAVVGWDLAARRPDLLRSLSAVSVPHPAAVARAALSGRQLLRSWYVGAFQLPWLPERLLGSGSFAATLRASGLPMEETARAARMMTDPRTARGALNWYRALVLPDLGAPGGQVRVPTLHVWSDGDPAIDRGAAQRAGDHVSGTYTFAVLQGVSHWVPETAPERLVALLQAHLAAADRLSAGRPGSG